MTNTKKRTCPFCNNPNPHPYLKESGGHGGGYPLGHYVACLSCKAQGPLKDTEPEALTAWGKTLMDTAENQRKCVQVLWDALSEILEEPTNNINHLQREAGLHAIAFVQKALPEEA